MVNDHIVEADGAGDVLGLCNRPVARGVAEGGVVVVRVNRTTPPVAATGRAHKVRLPVGGVDG